MSNDNNVSRAVRLTAFEAGKRRTVCDIRVVLVEGEVPEAVVWRGRVFVLDPRAELKDDVDAGYREVLACWPACVTGLNQG